MNSPDASRDRFALDTDRVWDLVGQGIDRLASDWEVASTPPDLGRYISDLPANVRATALIELIKLDMEQRWSRGWSPWLVERYLESFPELRVGDQVPTDLIYEEFHVRRQFEADVDVSDYFARFPSQAAELRRLLDAGNPLMTTSMRPRQAVSQLELGERLDDFDLLQRLGEGAFAVVFLAHQRSMQRLVAVKVAADSSHEPQTLARLDHPHIVRVYDQRVLPDRGLRLLYMQYVSGGTLQGIVQSLQHHPPRRWNGRLLIDTIDKSLRERGIDPPVGVEQRQRLAESEWPAAVCLLGAQLASALHYAHGQGVLHRDVKPANILINEAVRPLLVDFNVSACSKIAGASPATYFGGSLAYMSPEQLEACNPRHERTPDSLDGRSDIYSLGVVLWELLTGARPFVDQHLPEGWPATVEAMTARRQRGLTESHWQQFTTPLPGPLRALLARCFEPDAEHRYRSAAELETQLRRCLDPDAQRVFATPVGWRRAVVRWPALAMVLMLLIPNALAAWFNYDYNDRTIIQSHPAAKPIFENVQRCINATAFPLGVAVGMYFIWGVTRAVAARQKNPARQAAGRTVRQQCLGLAHRLAMLSLSLWIIAGIAYPAALYLANAPLGGIEYVHFFGSLTICGLIAASYPFCGAFALIIEGWYPQLCGDQPVERVDVPKLRWLRRLSWWYQVTAALVPLLSLAILIAIWDPRTRGSLMVLSAGSFVGLAVVFLLSQRLQKDLDVLERDAQGAH